MAGELSHGHVRAQALDYCIKAADAGHEHSTPAEQLLLLRAAEPEALGGRVRRKAKRFAAERRRREEAGHGLETEHRGRSLIT